MRLAAAMRAVRHLRGERVLCLPDGSPITRDRVIKAYPALSESAATEKRTSEASEPRIGRRRAGGASARPPYVRSVNPAALLVFYLLAVRPSRCGSPPSHTMGMAAEDSIMSKNPDTNSADRDAEIEREIQTNRKFSLSEAIGRMAGGLMKGGSPVTRKRQAELEVDDYLRRHLVDSGGVLRSVLFRQLGESLLNGDYDQPLAALAGTSEEFLRRRPSWRSSSAKPTRSGDECKTSGHTFKGQVGHLTLTIHTQSIQFASSYSNSARDSHRGRCRHTS